jgi:hypothetical protein
MKCAKRIVFWLALLLVFYSSPKGESQPAFVIQFTGNPVAPDFVQKEIKEIFGSLCYSSPNSTFVYPYGTQTLELSCFKRKSHHALLLENQPTPKIPGTFLLFSDHPEVVHYNGLLFSAGIIPFHPVRLNYYHQNAKEDPPRSFLIEAFNPSDKPAILHVIKAAGGPSMQIMETGHFATLLFLKRFKDNLGTIQLVPPHGMLVLSKQTAKGGELVTGFLQIMELHGKPLFLADIAQNPLAPLQEAYPYLTSKDTHARGAYLIPHIFFHAAYKVGKAPTIVRLGDFSFSNLNPGESLKGEYSTIWEGNVNVENPTHQQVRLPIFFVPRGGPATGTFFINHKWIEVGYTPPYKKVLLATIILKPYSQKNVHILSMPEGGSSYPIWLVFGE